VAALAAASGWETAEWTWGTLNSNTNTQEKVKQQHSAISVDKSWKPS